MSTTVNLGTDGLIRQAASLDFGPRGFTWTTNNTGPFEDALALAVAYAGLGWSGTMQPVPGAGAHKYQVTAKLETSDGSTSTPETANSPISTDWHWRTSAAQVPYTEHGDFYVQYQALIKRDPFLATAWDSVWRGVATSTEGFTDADRATLRARYPYLFAIVYKKEAGQSGFFRSEPSLEVVDRYQNFATYTLETEKLNKRYTSSQLIAKLKARRYNKIPKQHSDRIIDGEWLMIDASDEIAGDGTRVITQAFRWSPVWDHDVYESAV